MLLPAITPVPGMLICWRSVCALPREEPKFYGYTSRINLAGADVRLLVPTTFMNLSGKAVAAMATFYRINPDEIPVAHDELDLPPGGEVQTGRRSWRPQRP